MQLITLMTEGTNIHIRKALTNTTTTTKKKLNAPPAKTNTKQ